MNGCDLFSSPEQKTFFQDAQTVSYVNKNEQIPNVKTKNSSINQAQKKKHLIKQKMICQSGCKQRLIIFFICELNSHKHLHNEIKVVI